MSEWVEVGLGEVTRVRSGYSFKSAEWRDEGTRVVKIANIKSGSLDLSTSSFVDQSSAARASRFALQHGDVLLAMTGYVGEVARVTTDEPLLLNQRVGRFELVDTRRLDLRFLFYFLRLPSTREQLVANSHGSAQPNLSSAAIHSVPILLPALFEQRAIAEVLGALDDKIAANTKLVSTIDAMAQTMFKSIEAESSLLPLSETADFVNGKAFTKGASGTGRVVVRIAELNSGIGGSTVYSDANVEDKHVSRAGDILFAWSGSLTLHRWYRDDAIVNQHIFKVIPKVGYPSWLVYELIRAKLDAFKSIAADKATTMGHIQRHHLDVTVPAPRPEDIARIGAAMDGLWQQALAAERESLTLAEMREALLPELMSGRLRVKDVEKKIEEVV